MLAKWFAPARLETRTKESNIYASIWVFKTLMRNESEGRVYLLRLEALLHNRPIFVFTRDLSKSISVGTRKMVIYA